MSKSTPPEVEIRARVDRLRELLAKATPGPWQVNGCRGKIVTGNRKTVYHGIGPDGVEIAAVWFNEKTGEGFRDAHLIVEAINALPNLLSALTPQDERPAKARVAPADQDGRARRHAHGFKGTEE